MFKPLTIKVKPRTTHGGLRFFPADDFSLEFLKVFERSNRRTYTYKELVKLDELGLKILYVGFSKEEIREKMKGGHRRDEEGY